MHKGLLSNTTRLVGQTPKILRDQQLITKSRHMLLLCSLGKKRLTCHLKKFDFGRKVVVMATNTHFLSIKKIILTLSTIDISFHPDA